MSLTCVFTKQNILRFLLNNVLHVYHGLYKVAWKRSVLFYEHEGENNYYHL